MRFPFRPRSVSFAHLQMRVCLLLVVWLCAIARASAELDIGKPEWGFDGKPVENAFNLFTVEVRNSGTAAFEGELVLDDGAGFGGTTSAPYHQQVFIAPGTARIVQFYPYVAGPHHRWQLTWQAQGGGSVKFDEVTTGLPATVILIDPENPSVRSLRMRAFFESHFPSTVSATDGLHSVVLDHQPRWDPPRREAFIDWIKRGGVAHLVPGPDGKHPKFTEELSVLNSTDQSAAVGGGIVVRHSVPAAEVTPEWLETAGFPTARKTDASSFDGYTNLDSALAQELASVTRPNIAWGVIYTLTAIYVVLIGPVFYFLRKRDYRLVLAGFLGTVALFAWAFTMIGKRGYGERQIYHSIGIARAIEAGRWDVHHWVHPFATSGDLYEFVYPGQSQLFAALGQGQPIRGSILQGKDARFSADIPLFSSRPFLHRGVLAGPDLGLHVVELLPDASRATLQKLRLKVGPQFPSAHQVVAQYRDRFYKMNPHLGEWTATGGPQRMQSAFGAGDSPRYRNSRVPAQRVIEELRRSGNLLARRISPDQNSDGERADVALRPDQLRLFIYADAPPAFQMQTAEFQADLGLVLYVQDFAALNPLQIQTPDRDGQPTRN